MLRPLCARRKSRVAASENAPCELYLDRLWCLVKPTAQFPVSSTSWESKDLGVRGSGLRRQERAMGDATPHLMICNCEKTMPLDAQAIGRVCAGRITQANQLCGLDLERYKAALADGGPVTVACIQEAPRFNEVARDLAPSTALTFVNIRETAGWSKDATAAGPKAAALIAAAAEEMPPIPF